MVEHIDASPFCLVDLTNPKLAPVVQRGSNTPCPEHVSDRSGCASYRFIKQAGGGPIAIGAYVAMVSRLSTLWTAACGVVEIVSMIRRRRELLEVSCIRESRGTNNQG